MDRTYTMTDGTLHPYKVCTFTADKIDLGPGVAVTLNGSAALSLQTRNHGDITIATNINADGNAPLSDTTGGEGSIGGWSGGDRYQDGKGPGRGRQRTQGNRGGGGGFGGTGQSYHMTSHGQIYGDPRFPLLLGGSGGGGGYNKAGGAGGGAIELIAHGAGEVTIAAGAKISANGGDTTDGGYDGGE